MRSPGEIFHCFSSHLIIIDGSTDLELVEQSFKESNGADLDNLDIIDVQWRQPPVFLEVDSRLIEQNPLIHLKFHEQNKMY